MSTHLAPQAARHLTLQADPTVGDDPSSAPHGPGWFESSWALRAGLEVLEGPGDAALHGGIDR